MMVDNDIVGRLHVIIVDKKNNGERRGLRDNCVVVDADTKQHRSTIVTMQMHKSSGPFATLYLC